MSRLILASCLALFACATPAPDPGACENDLGCKAPGTRCDLENKRCVCATDEACRDGEFCNRAGVCQTRAGCAANADCKEPGTFCDAESGRCLTGPALSLRSACGLSSHCPYNAVCVDGRCEVGCFDDGDCVLGQICLDGLCASGEAICSEDAFCGYKQRCVGNECKTDRRGPYCRGCSFRTALNPEPCDAPKNYCLINSAERGGFRQFCGVDCSLGQPCPNGYNCNFVVILTEDTCVTNAQCQCQRDRITFATRTCTVTPACDPRNADGTPDPMAAFCVTQRQTHCNPPEGGDAACLVPRGQTAGFCTCATDADCGIDGTCVGGQCCTGPVNPARECRIGESRVSGFCSCGTDDDCPRDSCDPSRGACAITGSPCTPGNNDCGPIACVNGGCQIGRNCAPIQGLSCSQVGG